MKVIHPSNPIPQPSNTTKVAIEFTSEDEQNADYTADLNNLKVPIFELENVHCILIKDLCLLLNYPSSYHLMAKFVKSSSLQKSDFAKSDRKLNGKLAEAGLVDDTNVCYFYTALQKVYNAISNKDVLQTVPTYDTDDVTNTDKITLSQVFPLYGYVNKSLELKHSTFNCITNLSKYNYYKSIEDLGHLPLSKLSPTELENLYHINDYSKLEVNKPEVIIQNIKRRKPLGKPRKNATNVDPNTLDLKQTVIPGQGFIQEFNINHVCRVPTYYVTTNPSTTPTPAAATAGILSHPNASSDKVGNVKKEVKISRDVSQLVINNDYENFNFNKYFYVKAYRGPGSGNYKDAASINRINKIPATDKVLKKSHTTSFKKRNRVHLKGLTHEVFNKHYIDYAIKHTTGDAENMEMLHNTLQFNMLVNTYRDVSYDTWANYFSFKSTDFELLTERKHKDAEEETTHTRPANFGSKYLLEKFNLPQDYPEIVRKLPTELRSEIRKPLYFNMRTSETNNSEFLTNIDVIKLPNANSVGWDNLKKYHDP